MQTIIFITFWHILRFYQIFFLLQVKRSVIIINKYGIYELPNVLRHRILENWEKAEKYQNLLELWTSGQSSYQNETFFNTSQNCLKNGYWISPVMRCFKWELEYVSNIIWMIVGMQLNLACSYRNRKNSISKVYFITISANCTYISKN